jgi:2'-5' RNA ligase
MTSIDPNEAIRAFIAVPLDAALRQELGRTQQALQRRMDSSWVRWVPAEQLHLTLKFFGDVPSGQIAALAAAARRVGEGFVPFQLRAEGIGCFPDSRRPKVIWAGLGGDLGQLCQLQSRLEQETGSWGDHRESRSFRPHLTIGRVKATHPQELRCIGERIQSLAGAQLGAWPVHQIDLMRSQLSARGPTYTILASVVLCRSDYVRATLL